MKNAASCLLVALVAVNIWLLLSQRRLARQVESLRTQNAQLTEDAAQRPALSPEAVRDATRRLEQAQSFMDAVESRLSNATALVQQLQSKSLATSPGTPGDDFPSVRAIPLLPSANSLANPSGAQEAALPALRVASSHGPDGQLLQRNWGPEQVLGPPNTHASGDLPTAWAPQSLQGGEEWLHVNYDRPVDISEIRVRETHNPGAIAKLAAVLPNGQEVILWEGNEPAAQAPVDMTFNAPAGVQAQSVKIYLDRRRVPGWNEIDAVELIGRDGTRQWASSATASSSYADPSQR